MKQAYIQPVSMPSLLSLVIFLHPVQNSTMSFIFLEDSLNSQKLSTVVAGVVRALVITAHYLPSAAHISLFYCSAMPGIEMKATKNTLCHLL